SGQLLVLLGVDLRRLDSLVTHAGGRPLDPIALAHLGAAAVPDPQHRPGRHPRPPARAPNRLLEGVDRVPCPGQPLRRWLARLALLRGRAPRLALLAPARVVLLQGLAGAEEVGLQVSSQERADDGLGLRAEVDDALLAAPGVLVALRAVGPDVALHR